jgi:hypothetical protein
VANKAVNLYFPHWETQKNNLGAQLACCVGLIIFD